jgi:capsular exopolysaccharide synthesis family protein
VPAGDDEPAAAGSDGGAFLRALRRRWPAALALGLVAAALAAPAAWYFMPAKQTAHTLLRVEANQPSILFADPETRSNFANYQRAQLAMIKSRLVLNAALRQPRVAALAGVRGHADPVQWLEKELKADYSLAPEILRISMSGDRPDDLVQLVNAVREAYIQEVVDKEYNERRDRLEQLKKLYAEYEGGLRDKRRTLRELAESVGSRDTQTLAHKQQLALDRLAMTQKELIQVESELRKARVESGSLPAREKALDEVEIPVTAVEELLTRDTTLQAQTAELVQLERKLAEARRLVSHDDDPALAKYRTPVEAARRAIAERKETVRAQAMEQLRQKARGEFKAQAAQLRTRIGLLEEQKNQLAEAVKDVDVETRTINKGSIDLEALREEVAQAEEVAKKAGAQMEALKVEMQAPHRVRTLEEGVISNADGEKKRLMATGGAGLGGLLLAGLGIVYWEARARRVGTPTEVKAALGLRLVGTLPLVRERRGRAAATAAGVPLQEAVDATRTFLLRAAQAAELRTLMVTSAVSGEGKTSLSSQLAASLARGGYRTLLIDADLRNPSLHELFDVADGPGLSELLCGTAAPAEVVHDTPLPGLAVMPAGRFNERALQALSRREVRAVFDALKREYDLVIFDSAPVLPVADSLLVGQHVDAVVLSILQDVSRVDCVAAAQERLSLLDVRVLGAVVSGVGGSYGSRYYQKWTTQAS